MVSLLGHFELVVWRTPALRQKRPAAWRCSTSATGDAIASSKQKRQCRLAGLFDFECQELTGC